MKRMLVVVALAVSLVALPVLEAQASNPLAAIFEILEKLDRAVDVWRWSLEVGLALEQDEPVPLPPPQSLGGGHIQATLESQRQAIERLALPSLVEPLPSLHPAPSTSVDAIRDDLRPRIDRLRAVDLEAREARQLLSGLGRLRSSIVQRRQVASRLSELLDDLADTVGRVDLSRTLDYAVLDIEAVFIPLLGSCQSAAQEKARTLRRRLLDRAEAVRPVVVELRNLLILEEAILAADAQRLERSAEELRGRWEALEVRRQQLQLEEGALRRLRSRLQGLEQRDDELRDEIRRLDGEIRAQFDERAAYFLKQQGRYDLCPNRKAWDDCSHGERKARWTRQVASSAVVRSIDSRIQSYRHQQQSLRQERDRLSSQRAELGSELGRREAVLRQARIAYDQDRATWEAHFRRDQEDRWRSRADLHATQNQRDRATVEQVAADLDRWGEETP